MCKSLNSTHYFWLSMAVKCIQSVEAHGVIKEVACILIAIIGNNVINKIQVHMLTRLSGVLGWTSRNLIYCLG